MKTCEEYFAIAKGAYEIQNFMSEGTIMPLSKLDYIDWREQDADFGRSESYMKFDEFSDVVNLMVYLNKVQDYCENRMSSIDYKRWKELYIKECNGYEVISYRCYESDQVL